MQSSSLVIVLALLFVATIIVAEAKATGKSARRNYYQQEEPASRSLASNKRAVAKGSEDDDGPTPIFDESAAVDPEFATLTDDGSGQGADEDEASSNAAEAASNAPEQSSSGPMLSSMNDFSEVSGSSAFSKNNQPQSSQFDSGVDNGSDEPSGLDSNIANAKIKLSAADMATAAGHHHHHKHYVKGWLEMGAHTGKKGSFGWHDKHPVGGKGRR